MGLRKRIAAKLAPDELIYVRSYRRKKSGWKNAMKRVITFGRRGYTEVEDHLRKRRKRRRN